MSAAVETYRDDLEATYAVDFSRDREPIKSRARFPEYRRRGSAPSRVGGMHCRRNKRWTWGSGRGARMTGLRAVLMAAVAALSGSMASGSPLTIRGVQFEFGAVPGNPSAPAAPSGYGVVANTFLMALTEVTNTQYAQFLTATGAPNGTYKAGQQITQSGGTYTAISGVENHPVTFVNWFDAARFVNWLVSGNTETGAYALNGSNVVVARTAGAPFFLPSMNEWAKAAYFNPNTNAWNTYAVTGTAVAGAPVGTASTANYANVVGGTTAVKAYSLATSSFGMYDMLGNALEMLEGSPSAPGTIMRQGGTWFNTSIPTSSTVPGNLSPTAANNQIGFRVAAVPEPSTYALIAAGVASLGGFRWLKRRQRDLA